MLHGLFLTVLLLAPQDLAIALDAIVGEVADEPRSRLVYELCEGLERGTIAIRNAAEAERLVQVLGDLARHDRVDVTRFRAAEFLCEHPHPAAADLFVELAGSNAHAQAALTALVALRDARTFDLLAAHLKVRRGAREEILDLLADLGDRRALELLASLPQDDHVDRATRCLRRAVEQKVYDPFHLDERAFGELMRDGFTVAATDENEMFELYESSYPCVTSDVVLHTFALLVRASVDELEQLVIRPRLADWSRRFASACAAQAGRVSQNLQSLAWDNAAVFAVAAALLQAEVPSLPDDQRDRMLAELGLIRDHDRVSPSPLFTRDEDYTKYVPRGRARSLEMTGTLQAITWYGRQWFDLESPVQTRRALLLMDVLARDADLEHDWQDLDALLRRFFGERDDLAFPDYALDAALGPSRYLDLMHDERARAAFVARLRALPAPRIDTSTTGAPPHGLRVLGQRHTRPIECLQRAISRAAWPPSGLRIAADLLHSKRAREIAPDDDAGEPGQGPQIAVPADPFATVMEGCLHAARALFESDERLPAFMTAPAWQEKQINTALGAWTEVQHITAPYTKDANLYFGFSGMLDRFHGWVEPVPELYARLREMTLRLSAWLEQRDLFALIAKDREAMSGRTGTVEQVPDEEKLKRAIEIQEASVRLEQDLFRQFAAVLERLEAIARKELNGEPQSIGDGLFLRGLHRQLMHLAFNRSGTSTSPRPMAIVIDVASEYQSGECFEIAVGRPLAIFVAITAGDRKVVCRGAAYSYDEFTQPIGDRLDDERWKRAVEKGSPARTPWLLARRGH